LLLPGSYLLGFVNIEGPLLGGGAFHRGAPEDGVYLFVLD